MPGATESIGDWLELAHPHCCPKFGGFSQQGSDRGQIAAVLTLGLFTQKVNPAASAQTSGTASVGFFCPIPDKIDQNPLFFTFCTAKHGFFALDEQKNEKSWPS
jgi:hypothetical protein